MVREAAVDALLALYSNAENRGIMREFTERFRSRFLELPNDVDDSVAVKGVNNSLTHWDFLFILDQKTGTNVVTWTGKIHV